MATPGVSAVRTRPSLRHTTPSELEQVRVMDSDRARNLDPDKVTATLGAVGSVDKLL